MSRINILDLPFQLSISLSPVFYSFVLFSLFTMDYATPPDYNAYHCEPEMVPQNTAGGAHTRTHRHSDSTLTPGHLEHERDPSHYRVRLKQIYKTSFLLNLFLSDSRMYLVPTQLQLQHLRRRCGMLTNSFTLCFRMRSQYPRTPGFSITSQMTGTSTILPFITMQMAIRTLPL